NDGPRWYKPTWYTLTTEAVVGVTSIPVMAQQFFYNQINTKETLALGVLTIASALAAGEAARIVTTVFESQRAYGLAGAGAATGAIVLPLLTGILGGKVDSQLRIVLTGAMLGIITGVIAGIATGIETGLFAKHHEKLDNQKQNANETTNNATTKDNPKAETGEAKA
ncbi:MAG: hypothetical protein LE180_06715, partial [Endomicrobium sp.]|uniref:hypothetical protein n=1 Tax=Candidatus Endomicrobiellum pyrsonymphae TaxID=1408203 RepID=UPI003577FE5E|nr:hypothetical protein [Endomicrobium sp.]